ncbi:hydroxymethylglutaryl-CoA reductase, degradative [Weissella viridescens]|uniref:3-hydroxy-3-methylglutaryl coenzyme A reductase n=1 Tax=Weissella viridescens TaxID=1629 RepID=A0A3P2RI42_WEIVI|nr:hydroxymethylglutaryl-CoA reductase, degradative [Weissella viridescens]RRG18410.1 hydroxymethylglutaryl-CoA reductase, degradative [Weissella viridescens]
MKWSGYYKLDWQDRIQYLVENHVIDATQAKLMAENYSAVGDQQVENYLYNFGVPMGLLTDIEINGEHKSVPMATEEPSVIAAANNGARMLNQGDGVHAAFKQRLIRGQVIAINLDDTGAFQHYVQKHTAQLLAVANHAHPSMEARGGGAKDIVIEPLDEKTVAVDVLVDPCEAMGANVVNTMAEAVAQDLRSVGFEILMGILSNYATEALIEANVAIPVAALKTKQGMAGADVAQRVAQASYMEQLTPYRAVTANKGIMNGVEAVVLASGNDTRAVNAGMHAYAAESGQYKGLAQWTVSDDGQFLNGSIKMPLMLGVVGGSIGIVPAVQLNQQIMGNPDAQTLSAIVAGVALAQNLAALRALVSSGIQAGHMALQAKSLALQVGATVAEVPLLVAALEKSEQINQASAQALLANIRKEKR